MPDFFQDFSFNKPYADVILNHKFPESNLILTVCDFPEQWYNSNSLVLFHAKLWDKRGQTPTEKDLKEEKHIGKERQWHTSRIYPSTPKYTSNKEGISKKLI